MALLGCHLGHLTAGIGSLCARRPTIPCYTASYPYFYSYSIPAHFPDFEHTRHPTISLTCRSCPIPHHPAIPNDPANPRPILASHPHPSP